MKKKIVDLKILLDSFAQKGKWQSAVVKIISSDLSWLLIVCGIFRLLFYHCLLNTANFEDSPTYLNYNASIFLGEVDGLRTPVYPYFIKVIKLFGNDSLIQHIILLQSIISFFTIILFYKSLRIAFQSRAVILSASFIYGVMPFILNFDKCILTESLSVSAIVVFLYFIVNYLKSPTVLKAILVTFYTFFAIMLRPAFLILLPIMIIFWILRMLFFKTDRKMCLSGLATSLLCLLLIIGYCRLNYLRNGCNSISLVSQINQLDIIINTDLYLDGNDPEITETIKSNLGESHHGPWNNMDSILLVRYPHERITKYLLNCVINQPGIYIKKMLLKIIDRTYWTTSVIYATWKEGPLSALVQSLSNIFSINFLTIYLLLIFDFFYMLVVGVKSKQVPWFKIIVWSFITAQLAMVIFGAQGEYERLFVIALPFVIVLLFSYIDMLFYSTDKNKQGKYTANSFDRKRI